MTSAKTQDPARAYEFAVLSPHLSARLGLTDLPFPVRKTMLSTVFGPDEVRLRDVLIELDVFVKEYPRSVGVYQDAAGKLAMIAATEYMDKNNAKSALMCLSMGLRIDPGNITLRVHQALALQMNGYHGAAADEYAQILTRAPQAYDPTLRALAAKAYGAAGEWEEGLRILMYLPEAAFANASLAELRDWIVSRGAPASKVTKVATRLFCTRCGNGLNSGQKFCTSCGYAVEV